ncbi:MAG TPA: non-ribosomal peptide synthetase [Terriglobales bacterium]|nr:non-ribosomal peptide synthetase [Terriglobales bacterium]
MIDPTFFNAQPAPELAEPEAKYVHQLVSHCAMSAPDSLAAVCGNLSLTYADLDSRTNRLARLLQSKGVGPDVVVGIYLNRSIAMLVAALAVFKAGGAYLPLDPSSPPERLNYLLDDARAAALITGQCLSSSLSSRMEPTVVIDPSGQIAEADVSDDRTVASPKIASSSLAYVIYTSGSTGQPKGVELTHGGLMNLISWHHRAFNITAKDRASQLASLGFDAAVWEIWPYLTAGASVHLGDGVVMNEPAAVRDWLVSRGITITFLPTPLAERVTTLEWPNKHSLRIMLTGADTLHHYPSRKLRFQLVNNYGPTECTVVATSGTVPSNPEHTDQLPTIGRPIDNVQIHILDDKMKQVPIGEVGEIYLGGSSLARGYRNRPDLTAERFVSSPFNTAPHARLYKTGDLGKVLPNGEIAFLGRVDEQVKIRGYRIEPAEIVKVLDEHYAIQACAVVAREVEPGDKRLVAYFVAEPNATVSHTELRNFVASRLPEYMIPSIFVKLDTLPLNSSGKVDKPTLPAPDVANTLRDSAFVAPRNPIEERIGSMLASLLDVGEVSVQDNFFLLGGHSLLGTQLIARIRDAFGVELTLKSLFDAPTAAKLSAEVETLLMAKLEAMTDEEALRLLGGTASAAA